MDTITLRRVLCQQKPRIDCDAPSSKNTKNTSWPELRDAVTVWDDFHLANLNESYGHILDYQVPAHQLRVPRPDQVLSGVAINNLNSAKHLVVWNDGIMRPTLRFAKEYIGLHSGVDLRHRVTDADKTAIAHIPHGPKNLFVDHVTHLDDFPLPTLVIGLARPSSRWSGGQLARQLDHASDAALWPLRQLANLYKASQTRYGYIQTDEEMTVCLFSKDGNEGDATWTAAIMPVP